MAKINPTSQLITHIIEMSFGVAIGLEHTIVTTEHVLLGMLQKGERLAPNALKAKAGMTNTQGRPQDNNGYTHEK